MTALLKRQTCVFKPSVAFNGDHIAGTDAAVETDPSQRYLRVRKVEWGIVQTCTVLSEL